MRIPHRGRGDLRSLDVEVGAEHVHAQERRREPEPRRGDLARGRVPKRPARQRVRGDDFVVLVWERVRVGQPRALGLRGFAEVIHGVVTARVHRARGEEELLEDDDEAQGCEAPELAPRREPPAIGVEYLAVGHRGEAGRVERASDLVIGERTTGKTRGGRRGRKDSEINRPRTNTKIGAFDRTTIYGDF